MTRIGLFLLALVIGLCQARILPNRGKQVKAYTYVLPAGAEEIRDDINHSFVCANRTDGFYVDVDNDCQIFHRCQDRARYSFICAEKTVFSQMYQTCVHEGQLGYPCEDSAMFYPEGGEQPPAAAPNSNNVDEPSEAASDANAAAAKPSQELEPPKETPISDGANTEDEKETGSVVMPLSDNFIHAYDHQQLHDNTFDPVGEDEADNTAQEVTDDQTEGQVSEDVGNQTVEINDSTLEDEKNDEIKPDEPIQESPVEQPEDQVLQSDDKTEEIIPQEIPSENVESGLQSDVQVVEELEPIVVENEPENVEHSEVTKVEPPQADDVTEENSQTPESNSLEHNTAEDIVATEIQSVEDKPEETNPTEQENAVSEIELDGKDEESTEPKLSEPLVMDTTSNEPAEEIPNEAQQEPVEEVDDRYDESHPLQVAAQLSAQASSGSSEGSLRKISLPEFIVSTVADLRKGVPAPTVRRRKTFLFKADAKSV